MFQDVFSRLYSKRLAGELKTMCSQNRSPCARWSGATASLAASSAWLSRVGRVSSCTVVWLSRTVRGVARSVDWRLTHRAPVGWARSGCHTWLVCRAHSGSSWELVGRLVVRRATWTSDWAGVATHAAWSASRWNLVAGAAARVGWRRCTHSRIGGARGRVAGSAASHGSSCWTRGRGWCINRGSSIRMRVRKSGVIYTRIGGMHLGKPWREGLLGIFATRVDGGGSVPLICWGEEDRRAAVVRALYLQRVRFVLLLVPVTDIICVFEHVGVHHQVEAAGAVRCQLTHDDVFSHSTKWVDFCMKGRLKQDFHSLLERALPERSRVYSVDTMPRDWCEDAPRGHDVAKRRAMTIVDVDAVGTQNRPELVEQALPRGLHAEDSQDLAHRVGPCTGVIDLLDRQDLLQGDAICLNYPVVGRVRWRLLASLRIILFLCRPRSVLCIFSSHI